MFLLLPIGDDPNDTKRIAWMNYALIGINLLVFVLVVVPVTGKDAVNALHLRWGYTPASPSLMALLTCQFMHADWGHLLGNMLFLWIFGDNIEMRLGHIGYLVAYLAVGVVATLSHAFFTPESVHPLIGASGAISGVQGMYFIACARHRVKLFIWVLIIIVRIVSVNARLIMVLWFVMRDLWPVVIGHGPSAGGVAHMAHLGGFAAGLALMLALKPMLARIDQAAADELGHATRYHGSGTTKYRNFRRKNPYRSRQ